MIELTDEVSYNNFRRIFDRMWRTGMAYNEVSKKATNTYRSKFDIIQIRVPQGSREQISKHASSCGESINAFINRAITETITRDTQKNQPERFIKTNESQED